MGDNSKINKQSSVLADEAAARAKYRVHQRKAAQAGAETAPSFLDSSDNSIADASPLSMEQREKAKKALHG